MNGPTVVEDVVEVPLQLAIDGSAHPYPTRTAPIRRRRRRPRPAVENRPAPGPGQLDGLGADS